MNKFQKKRIGLPDISGQPISVLLPMILPPSGGPEFAELGPSGQQGSHSAPRPAPLPLAFTQHPGFKPVTQAFATDLLVWWSWF